MDFSQTTLKDHLGTYCKSAYLSKVGAELKTFKKEIDDIIDSYLSPILDNKLKLQILYRVWQSIS